MAISINPTFQGGKDNINKIISFHHSSNPLTYYQEMNIPFMIVITSNHPEDPDNNVFSIFTPDSQYNCVTKKALKGRSKDSLHQHNYFEFMYILKGNMYQIVEGKRYLYTPGSCCLLNRNTLHTEELSTEYQNIFFSVSTDFISRLTNYGKSLLFPAEHEYTDNLIFNFLKKNIEKNHKNTKDFLDFVPMITETQQKIMVHDIFEQMLYTLLNPYYGATYRLQDLFCQLIDILCNPRYYNAEHVTARSNLDSLLFVRIGQLLEENNGRISNQELSQLLNYDGSYLGRIVKKFTGKSLFDYSLTFTMAAAEHMLKNTKKSVSEIVLELQFSNRTHFYKLFVQYYGMTPQKYRQFHMQRSIHPCS